IDELSLGLAPAVFAQLLPMIARIRDHGTTVIIVEQSVNLALTIAETAYFMGKGESRFHRPTAEWRARPDSLRSRLRAGVGAGSRAGSRPESRGQEAVRVFQSEARSPADASADASADAGDDGRAAAKPVDAAIQVADVRVRFGGIEAVGGVSLSAAPGEIV